MHGYTYPAAPAGVWLITRAGAAWSLEHAQLPFASCMLVLVRSTAPQHAVIRRLRPPPPPLLFKATPYLPTLLDKGTATLQAVDQKASSRMRGMLCRSCKCQHGSRLALQPAILAIPSHMPP